MSEPQTIETIPPLVDGERLDRAEFHRRYEAMPQIKRAELIEGVVYMPSPVHHRRHGGPHLHLGSVLGVYEASTPGIEASDNASEPVKKWVGQASGLSGNGPAGRRSHPFLHNLSEQLDDENEPQPDLLLLVVPDCGGRVELQDDTIVHAPELVVEISASRLVADRGPRFRSYQANGASEYLLWRIDQQAIDWFILRNGAYDRLQPDAAGIIKSEAFPGLRLHVAAMIRLDLATALSVLQQGLSSPEHQAFVELLAQRRGGQP